MIVAYIGDLIVTQTTNQALDRDDPLLFHYTVNFRDVPTGRSVDLHADNEMEAILMVAAWLMADEENIDYKIRAAIEKLYSDLPKDSKGHHIFMP